MSDSPIKVLLIEDDEDDYVIVRNLLTGAKSSPSKFVLEWVTTYESALNEVDHGQHDVYLLDYLLGNRNGLELLHEMIERGCKAPIIFLTGQGDYKVDMEAMKAGAADYLEKGQISSPLLERSIRYAIERKKAESAVRESERQLKFLSSQLLTVQETERKRVATELHDNLGQVLSAIKFGVENTVNRMEQGTAIPATLQAVIPTLQYAIEEVRRIYTHLRPSLLDDLGILATVAWFCREFHKVYPDVSVRTSIRIEESEIPESLKIVIYRVLQEAMNNVALHSKATQSEVSLSKTGDTIELMIMDNGHGFEINELFSSDSDQRGLGIASMKERVELSGGFLVIESAMGSGTCVRAFWPCP
jgi:signal transduction histidine kinase